MNIPNLETLNEELKLLNERVARIEQDRAEEAAEATQHLDILSSEHAMREALLQFTQEVAVREGVPAELFVERFEAAKEWHRDRFLRMVEGVDPDLAAKIDERAIHDVPTEDMPPCIFPESDGE
jgi:hypothetical protein